MLTLNDKGEQLCGELISDRQSGQLDVLLQLQEELVPKKGKKVIRTTIRTTETLATTITTAVVSRVFQTTNTTITTTIIIRTIFITIFEQNKSADHLPRRLLQQFAGIRGVEADAKVEGDRHLDALHLLDDLVGGVQPALENLGMIFFW